MPRPPPQGAALTRLPEPDQMGTLVVRTATNFAQRHKLVTGVYLLGWLFLLLVGRGTQLTVTQQGQYNRILNSIDLQAEYDATAEYWHAREAYYHTKGWFWSCDARCQRNKQKMQRAEAVLHDIQRESAARVSDAKRTAGIFSEIGVAEIKDSFWQYLGMGKQFAKRQSMWDALFMGIRTISRGRDESWIEYGLKILMQVLVNFTMGLAMALVFFWMGLWSIVRSYQTNPLTALLVFCGAGAAGFAYVVSYLLAIYGAAGASVYGVLKLAETSQRARLAQGQQQRQRVQYGYYGAQQQQQQQQQRRSHYD